MVSVIQGSSDVIEQWPGNNDMRINTIQKKEMVICFLKGRTCIEFLPYLYINKNSMERISQTKAFGVNISPEISWNARIGEIVSNARKRADVIYQLNRAHINHII